MRASAGGIGDLAARRSGGSSLRIAAIVSGAVSRRNARLPDRSSYRMAPKANRSARWSTSRSTDLLGRHVADRAEDHSWLGRRRHRGSALAVTGVGRFCVSFASPKSRILMRLSAGDEHVLGFEIAMDDSLVVRRREPLRDLKRLARSPCERRPGRH